MPAPAKKPRRTAERILDVSLALFNQLGEPNVSTTALSAELGISPGNLYYHFPAKDTLINALTDRFEASLDDLLRAAPQVRHVEDAWLFFHMLFELIWEYRFLYRDLNDLLSKNRRLEAHVQAALRKKIAAVRELLAGLSLGGGLTLPHQEAPHLAKSMVVLITYWLSFEYACDPRHALEPEVAGNALLRGAFHVLHLLAPHLDADQQELLHHLARQYSADPGPA
jgi:AcrR family transcriptional regulator